MGHDHDTGAGRQRGQARPYDGVGTAQVGPRAAEPRRPVGTGRTARLAGSEHLAPGGAVGDGGGLVVVEPSRHRHVAQPEGALDPLGVPVAADQPVDEAVDVGGLGGVRVGRGRLARDLLDDARAGEADRRAGLGHPNVRKCGVRRVHPAGGRRPVDGEGQQPRACVGARRVGGARHLDEGDHALLHPRATRRRHHEHRDVSTGRSFIAKARGTGVSRSGSGQRGPWSRPPPRAQSRPELPSPSGSSASARLLRLPARGRQSPAQRSRVGRCFLSMFCSTT